MTAAPMCLSSSTRSTTLDSLVRELAAADAWVRGDGTIGVQDVRQDSRQVKHGDLFAARAGARARGADFVADAVTRGAAAVLVERGTLLPGISVPVIEVADMRLAIALAAEAVHGHPSRALDVVGITGTNGKTTTAWLAAHAVSGAGGRAASLGTLGYFFEGIHVDSPLTTPEPDQISRYAAQARDSGASHLLMEVSSHALDQKRVDALRIRVAAFSNLTQDHLDYHENMRAYAETKARLFCELSPDTAVVNVDDAFGVELAQRAHGRVLRVSRTTVADVYPRTAALDATGIRAEIELPSGVVSLRSRLVGDHNLENLLVTLAIVEALALDPARAAEALADVPPIPGRLERCDEPDDDILVAVDYAHTPDALHRALRAVRELTSGRLLCVFGCGGDRDPDKRPKMGSAVGAVADFAIVSNDNPRSEAPQAIAAQIEPGLRPHDIPYVVELDRAAAIEQAILEAAPGDVVLIAGKGHEPYQIIGTETRAFDDRVEARRALALRRKGAGR